MYRELELAPERFPATVKGSLAKAPGLIYRWPLHMSLWVSLGTGGFGFRKKSAPILADKPPLC